MSDNFISMRYQRNPAINGFDFAALKQFERAHPELYTKAARPRSSAKMGNMLVQANAFNAVFSSEKYRAEFKALIKKIREGD